MKKHAKRLIAVLLAVIMVCSAAPVTVLASLLDNDPAYNREILKALQSVAGSEDKARDYYDIMEAYGLLDEDGNLAESWSIQMGGEDITLDELRGVLAGDYDPAAYVWVDGVPVTLEDVKTMIEIEDYIAYIRETYYSDIEWTPEQKESLESLVAQIQSSGIKLRGAAHSIVGPSGVNHASRVSVAQTAHDTENRTVTFTANLTGAANGQTVTFEWKALSGSRPVTGTTSGTVTLTANGSGEASAAFSAYYDDIYYDIYKADGTTANPNPVRTAGNTVFYVNCYNIKNALFSNEKESLSICIQTGATVEADLFPSSDDANYVIDDFLPDGIGSSCLQTISYDTFPKLISAIRWGMISHVNLEIIKGVIPPHAIVVQTEINGTFIDGRQYYAYYFPNLNTIATDLSQRDSSGNPVEWQGMHYGVVTGSYPHSGSLDPIITDELVNHEYNLTDYPTKKSLLEPWNLGVKEYVCYIAGFSNQINSTRNAPGFYSSSNTAYESTNLYSYLISPFGSHLRYKLLKYTLSDPNSPAVKSWSIPAGTYYPGEVIPIIVTFSEPVQAGATVTVNGKKVTAAETGASNVMTFPYEVQEVDNTQLMITNITAKDIVGNNYSGTPSADTSAVIFQTPLKSHSFTGISGAIGGTSAEPVFNVSVNVSGNEAMTQWMGSDFTPDSDGGFISKSAKVTVDGENFFYLKSMSETVTGGTLTASIPLSINISGRARDYVAELYLNDELVIGKAVKATQEPAVFITADDMSLSVSVKDKNGNDYVYADSTNTIYAQDRPVVAVSYSLTDKDYAFPDVKWSSSDDNVALIDENTGAITISGAGKVKFRLTADNGHVEGKSVYKETDELTFGTGLTPYLYIPNNFIQSVDGKDTAVYWSTNLCEKNGANETVFTVTLSRGGNAVRTETVTGTAANPASGYTIKGCDLEFDYVNTSNNICEVEISAVYQGKTYTDTATIQLESLPARISLTPLESYYILDTAGSVNIGWDITNFNLFSAENSSELFRLLITKGSETVYDSDNPGTGGEDGHYTGNYTLDNLAFKADSRDKTSYRQVYTVTVQAKNGEDSTWSYDSYILYVYDADSLKLWIDGQDKGSLTMTNVPRISQMSQEQIIALKRDISLHNVVSANYGEYAWSELADQLAWASSDNDVATVNYQQGTLYEDIRNFSYVSYRPTTDFVISGLSDGQTTVSAQHVLTGMSDSINVSVETLKDKLYLFQCYPQVNTELTYKDSVGKEKTVLSDRNGAAAIYEEGGICSDVYCRSADKDGNVYLGTFYQSQLESGERDSTKLQLYPCNNLQMRRAAYAYLYLKNPDGTPYTGKITFRGGVYVDGDYKPDALFELNRSGHVNLSGETDQTVRLGSDGKLEIIMDQTQWGLPGNEVSAGDRIRYTFLIKQKDDTSYLPVFANIDATVNQTAYVASGEAVVNFRQNTGSGEHPFILGQAATMKNPENGYKKISGVLDTTGRVGPTDNTPEADLTTIVMWWGENEAQNGRVRLLTEAGQEIAPGASTQNNSGYPFVDETITTYTVTMTDDSLKGVVDCRDIKNICLEYYLDGSALSRKESLPFLVCNMVGASGVNESLSLQNSVSNMGNAMGTDAKNGMSTGDKFVGAAMTLVAGDSFTKGRGGLFNMKLAPTSDPTKFLGFIEVNVGNMDSDSASMEMFYEEKEESALSVSPGYDELETLYYATYGGRGVQELEDYRDVALSEMENSRGGYKDKSAKFAVGGYVESLIYYDFNAGEWKIQVLDGGFHAGGGLEYTEVWNYMVGPVPFTVELNIGGTAEVSMDAITAAYQETGESTTADLDTEFLTQLRIHLYLRLFAGVGFDYSVVAFKLGIFGQIDVNMRFRWLNRPYLSKHNNAFILATGERNSENANLNGQNFKIDGTIGLEFIVKFLFISYEKTLFSFEFNLLNKSTGKWDRIDSLWQANRKNTQAVIESLLGNGSATIHNANGQQMLSLNMAPVVENRTYLSAGGRDWNTPNIIQRIIRTKAAAGLNSLESNTYPYANPELSDDGSLLVYLSDMDSTDVEQTRAAFAKKSGGGYIKGGVISDGGYGDSQITVSGTDSFAVSAWTRQTVELKKDAGSVLTGEDQVMMLNGTEIMAAVYDGSTWSETYLTDNSGADMAPTAAVNGNRAIVAWRSVVAGDADNITNFDQKDTILYKIYENGAWSEPMSLYNGTGGAVKGLTSAIMDNGTAAVAYTLDIDGDDNTMADREIVYAVVGTDGEVTRNVRATSDEKLDENPQLAVVTFPGDEADKQHFVLGWFTQEMQDGINVSDICLFDFDDTGVTGQILPQSLSQASSGSDVNVTSDFRFSKNAQSIDELSIVWVERDEGKTETLGDGTSADDGADSSDMSDIATEKDVLKGIKFYFYGQNGELIGFTGALNVAEMPDATLIDHFDAYSEGGTRITASVLGTTYGEDGETETKTGETTGGDTVQYTVPKAVSAMYTASDSYEDKIEVPAVKADYDTIKLGSKTQIQVNIRNNGINPVSELKVKIGNTITEFTGLNLLPGNTLQVWADYDIPDNRVVDPDYTVTAEFEKSGKKTAEGKVYLDLTDLQITDARIMDESDGKRIIQVKMNNGSDAALEGSGRSVKLSFWSDPSHKNSIAGLPDMIISDSDDLRMIDEGGYSIQATFDAATYVKGDSAETKEIPESGIPIYIKAEVIKDDAVDPETSFTNNTASVTCDNLKARTGQDVTLVSSFDVSGDDGSPVTTVTVNMQNTRLSETATGNLVVTLLDENGEVLEQQQSYHKGEANNGLISLGSEAKGTSTFTFNKVGADAKVTYSDMVLDYDNVNLSLLSFSNITGLTLADFAEQTDGSYAAATTVDDIESVSVLAAAESAYSTVSVSLNGGSPSGESNSLSQTVALNPARTNTITVTVTSHDGDTRDYVLTLLSRKSIIVKADAKEKTYSQTDPELTYTVTGLIEGDDISVKLSREAGENVGGYAINADIEADEGYIVNYESADLTINQKPLTVTADAKSKTYGEKDPEFTWAQEGLVDGDDLGVTLSREEGNDVGDYTINADIDVSDNYAVTYVPANLTIGKKKINITIDAKTKIYGEKDPELTYSIDGLEYGDEIPVDISREPGENIGSYRIITDFDAGGNYTVNYTGAELTITKKTLKVTADPKAKIYGQEDPELTFVVTGLEGDDKVTGKLTREPGENIGEYAISLGTVDAGDNYDIDFTGAILTVSGKVLNITAHAQTKTYGQADPELTYTVEGLEDGDTITGALSRDEGENTGEYAILPGTLSAGENYAINYTGATLSIGVKQITVAAEPKTKVYGNQDPELTFIVEGLEDGDEIGVTLTREQGENTGTYIIDAETDGRGNYDIIYIPAEFTITKRPLTVTANPKYKRIGKDDPALTYSVDGLVKGDKVSVTLSREPGDEIGEYPITAEIDAGNNYDVTYVGAVLRVEKEGCPLCGDIHKDNFFGRIISLIHRIIYWIKNFFINLISG